MAKLIIEIVHPLRFLREYRTFDAPQIRIGHGYDNDLVLGDPHVSPAHLIVRSRSRSSSSGEEQGWIVEDIGRENGMYLRKLAKVVDQARLDPGDEIVIGHTRLRFLSPEHPVSGDEIACSDPSVLPEDRKTRQCVVDPSGVRDDLHGTRVHDQH